VHSHAHVGRRECVDRSPTDLRVNAHMRAHGHPLTGWWEDFSLILVKCERPAL